MRLPKSHTKLKSGTIEAWLVSDNSNDQLLAEEALNAMSREEQTAFYQCILTAEYKGYASPLRNRIVTYSVGGVGLSVLGISCFMPTDIRAMMTGAGLFTAIGMSVTNLILLGLPTPFSQLQSILAQRFANQAEIGHLPDVLKFMFGARPGFAILRPAMLRLLPRMTPEQRDILPDDMWDFLGRCVATPEKKLPYPVDTELRRAILHGIGKAGDKRMRPVLETVAKTSEDESLRQLASNYLSLLAQQNEAGVFRASQPASRSVESEPVRQQIAGRG